MDISIDFKVNKPIYKQIIHSICDHIDNGLLKIGDSLPSVNQVMSMYGLSRGTVFTAYNELKSSGIIKPIPGKGYFVSSVKTGIQHNIFLLFTTFVPYKEILFNVLVNSLEGKHVCHDRQKIILFKLNNIKNFLKFKLIYV